MKTQLMLAAAALILATGCFPDVGEGKARATVSKPAPEAAAVEQTARPAPELTRTIAVDGSKSKIAAVGAKVTGKHDIAFEDWNGALEVTEGELTGVDIEIQMKSLRSDDEKLTGHLHSPDFFDVAKFPTATFAATKIEKKPGADGATHLITGNLTMHGVTRELSFPASVHVGNRSVEASADFVIDRKDFDITYPGMPDDLIKDDVALSIALVGSSQDA